MTPEQKKFIAVLTALYPEGIAVEEYQMIIEAADLAERACNMPLSHFDCTDPPTLSADGVATVAKTCDQCRQILPLNAFYKNAKSPDGRRNICKNCKPHRGGRRSCLPKQPTSAEINAVRAKAK